MRLQVEIKYTVFQVQKPCESTGCFVKKPKIKWAATSKNGLWRFRTGQTQIGLQNHRRWLENWNFGFRKKRDCTHCLAKTKVLVSCGVIAQLICAFVFAIHVIFPYFGGSSLYFANFLENLPICQIVFGYITSTSPFLEFQTSLPKFKNSLLCLIILSIWKRKSPYLSTNVSHAWIFLHMQKSGFLMTWLKYSVIDIT